MYRILIVEDDLIIAKSIKNHIKSWDTKQNVLLILRM